MIALKWATPERDGNSQRKRDKMWKLKRIKAQPTYFSMFVNKMIATKSKMYMPNNYHPQKKYQPFNDDVKKISTDIHAHTHPLFLNCIALHLFRFNRSYNLLFSLLKNSPFTHFIYTTLFSLLRALFFFHRLTFSYH